MGRYVQLISASVRYFQHAISSISKASREVVMTHSLMEQQALREGDHWSAFSEVEGTETYPGSIGLENHAVPTLSGSPLTRCCMRTREGLSHPFAMDAEPTRYPALLSEVLWAVQTPRSPFPSLSKALAAPQDPRDTGPLIGSARHYCFPFSPHRRASRLSPIEDAATSIVPADFPTAPGPRAPSLIVMVLAQPQGQRPGAS